MAQNVRANGSYESEYTTKKIAELYTANGVIPVYKIRYKDTDIAFYLSRVGAPACVVGFEEIIAMGVKNLFCSVPAEYWTLTR